MAEDEEGFEGIRVLGKGEKAVQGGEKSERSGEATFL